MLKADIVKAVATKLDIPPKEAYVIVAAVLETVKQGIVEEGRVILRGFGSFHAREKSERVGRNPKTGEPAVIKARRVPTFKASKSFKLVVNRGNAYV